MSLPSEILVVQVDIKANNERLVELTKQLNENKAAQKALADANKAGTLSADELAAGQVRLKQSAADIAQETRILTKANADQDKANKASAGSINQLRAELSRGTAAYNAMSEAERDNTEAGQSLQAANKALSDSLKRLEGAVGDNRRNVGNYKDSLKDAIKESGFLGGITSKVTEAQETFSKAQVIAKAAIGGNVTALGFLRLALLASGLGALVIVLGSVVAFLTKSQTGIDLVSRKFAGLKAVLDLVVGVASQFGETLVNALSNPKQAITDLIAFIETNLVNRVKAIGIIFQALADRDFRKANDGLIQLTVGITNASGKLEEFGRAALSAAKAGEAIEAESQRILRAERALNVERSESRARIEQLKKLSDDSTKSVVDRLNAAKEAGRIENGLLAAQLKLQQDKINNTVASSLLDRQQTNDELDAIAELRAARADTQQESLTLQTELQNKINSLATEGAAAAAVARDFANRARQVDLLETLRVDTVKVASNQQSLDEKQVADTAAYERDLRSLDRFLATRQLQLQTDYAEGRITKESYELALTAVDKTGLQARLLLATKHKQDVAAAEAAITKNRNEELLKRADADALAQQRRIAETEALTSSLTALFAETVSTTGATLEDFLGKALLLIIDSMGKAVIAAQVKIIAEALATSQSAATFGVAGFAQAAATIAAVTVATSALRSQLTPSPKQFAVGGLVSGPGTGTSDSIPARLSNGESVINANTTAMFAPLLSHLNQLGGGVAFASGGLVPGSPARATPANDGGFVARQLGAAAPIIDYAALAQAMTRVNLEVGVTPLRKASARYDSARALSTLGG